MPAVLEQVMLADQFRLRKAWERLQAGRERDATAAQEKWQARAIASAERRARREASLPALTFDPELPITAHREEIIELLKTRQTIVVCGETGSGKSTQLPKLCLEAGLGIRGTIGHTQPRRLAARAVSSRLAEELGSRVGELVGFKIRFTDTTQGETLVKLMTDGVLLAETQSDRYLEQYDALIIDEAHERSLNIDFLLGYLRQLSARRPDLKLIITSATIDPQRFAEHFADAQGPAPIVEVSGRTYPVEMRYRPVLADEERGEPDEEQQLVAIADAADELLGEGPGDVLVFLPTERDIRLAAKHLRGHFTRLGGQTEILPLYARLSQAEQNRIFAGHAGRRIILSTNVAESSLTVPGIHYVIDTGLVRISRYAPRSKVQRLPIEGVSQASANQRSGRCGRLGPGICIRLFSESDYQSRPRFTTPEIRRSDLASVLLQSKTLRLGPLEEFPLLDPPSTEALRDANRTLRELNAIDERSELTAIGKQLGRLPCEPRVGRMLLEAHQRDCLAEVVIIAAAIEGQDVRQRPAGQRPQADEAHAEFADPHSDFLSYLRIWDFYEHLRSDLGRSRLQRALNQKFLSLQGCREWSEIVRQLKDILADAGIKTGARKFRLPKIDQELLEIEEQDQRGHGKQKRGVGANKSQTKKLVRPPGYEAIHQALLAGLLSGVAQRGDRYEYKAAGGLGISLWPGSGLFKRRPQWIMVGEIVETAKRYGRTVAEVDVEWIEKAAGSLLKHSYSDPHWSSKTGAAMVYRKSTLYGLPIIAARRVQLAPIDRSGARDLMIEHGLVEGDWRCNEPFYTHNAEMLEDMHELAQRTRSRDYILDRYHLANFYNRRIPENVFDLPSLRAWIQSEAGQPAVQALWMQPEDLLANQVEAPALEQGFPNTIQLGLTTLPLEYHFEPGHEADGVTVTVPQAALRQISDEALGWLVPGLLEEKVLHLIRSLPKSLRTNFVPAPDVAKVLAAELSQVSHEKAFSQALCEVMSQYSGERVTASCFDMQKLPNHLRMQVRVVDDAGTLVDSGRNIPRLLAEYSPPEIAHQVSNSGRDHRGGVAGSKTKGGGQSQKESSSVGDWTDRPVTPNDFDQLPEQVAIRRGGLIVAAFPALVDLGERVEMRLADTQQEAERLSRRGMMRLLAIKHHRSLRSQVANLPKFSECSVRLGHLIASKDLGRQLQDLIIRIALIEGQPLVRKSYELDALNARASVQISIATQEVAAWLPKLAEQVHALRLKLEKAPSMWQEVLADLQTQNAERFCEDFLVVTPWQQLAEYPRYLQAAGMRLEKLTKGGVAKDRSANAPIEKAVEQCRELRKSDAAQYLENSERLDELRWMIEELRVSVFAQQLGTKLSVSPKKVQATIDALRW
ncbi:ATP-dependent RNA helicase HrpB [Aureliella helgolandensis]|uniref:ATP-dependent RNA helicase HrpB n=2 Tax=Aureliella helgolandensis TaxID=2527968 RepID=A0A518FZF1_9BACT|nr:ATP-dependent RNA helicase HrpB [Aureliella helgolandensis]